jgi:hypothetical protein
MGGFVSEPAIRLPFSDGLRRGGGNNGSTVERLALCIHARISLTWPPLRPDDKSTNVMVSGSF